MIKFVGTSLIFLSTFLAPTGQEMDDCSKVKNGKFYYNYGQERYIIIREGLSHQEVNLATNDTSFYEANWSDSCTLNLKFLRSTENVNEREKSFLIKNDINIRVVGVQKEYYTFYAVGVDPLLSKYFIEDTIWFNAR